MKKIDKKRLTLTSETLGTLTHRALGRARGGIHWSDDCSSVCTAGACSARCVQQTTVDTEALCAG